MVSLGIEPRSWAPETHILSVVLRDRPDFSSNAGAKVLDFLHIYNSSPKIARDCSVFCVNQIFNSRSVMKTKALRENTILHSNLSLKRQDLKDMNTLDKKGYT